MKDGCLVASPIGILDAGTPTENIAAAGHEVVALACQLKCQRAISRGHHLWATVLGIRSPMMPKRYPARLENQGIKGI